MTMVTPLRIAHLVAGTDCEGPGTRTAVWVQGCAIRCPGCCNPELFDAVGGTPTLPDHVLSQVLGEGLTLLGGEPFDQPAGLADLLEACANRPSLEEGGAAALSTVVFTGYTREHLEARAKNDAALARALSAIDVLVDGPYRRDRPDPVRRFVGSTNQRIHFLTDRYGPPDFEGPRSLELRYNNGTLTVVGWPSWR